MLQAFIVVDLGYGDAGKGTTVDFLTRQHQAQMVIRFNGGCQAAHNVVTPDGRHHTFAQFGSGVFSPGVQTHLSRHTLIEPYALFNEEVHLRTLGVTDAFQRLDIDRRALVTTPYQQAANRLRELARGPNRHGSCGVGIGETVADHIQHGEAVIYAGDLPDMAVLRHKLRFLREFKRDEISEIMRAMRGVDAAQDDLAVFDDDDLIDIAAENYVYLASLVNLTDEADWQARLKQAGTLIFEGAQGVLLDQDYGFSPYTTWSRTTPANARDLLTGYTGDVTTYGVLRTYATRHGAGPFLTEDAALTAALPEPHNTHSPWQQGFRVGYLDLVALRYALRAAGTIDALVLTHLDSISKMPEQQVCTAYYGPAGEHDHFDYDDNGLITNLKPGDLAHQEQLARLLFTCQPRYEPIGDYIETVEAATGLRVAITSHGLTADNKRFIPPAG